MFIYCFENPLFKNQWRKLILNFPITQEIRDAMAKDGFTIEIDLFGHFDYRTD